MTISHALLFGVVAGVVAGVTAALILRVSQWWRDR